MNGKRHSCSERSETTRQRLLQTALHLYSAEGLDAVSLRRISAAAGSRNSAALHYHFHNKLGVIEALVEMIAAELTRIDADLRDRHGAAKTLREACRATLLPLALLPQAQPWGRDAIGFIARLLSATNSDIAQVINRIYGPFWQHLDRALAQQLPDLPAQVRQLRLLFMSTNVFHGLAEADWLAYSPLEDLSHIEQGRLLDHLVDYLLGGLQAPSHPQHQAMEQHQP